MTARIGVDTGGTFTDLVATVDDVVAVAKVPSTPDDPARAVLSGIRSLGLPGVPVVHGTTVATNALLERRGARVLFVTTEGFEDLARIGRQDRPALYDPVPERAEPLHAATLGIGPDGLSALVPAVREAKAEAVAVCLLDAYRDPTLEDRIGELIASIGVPVSLSSRVLREFREYERAATTLADAYVLPVVGRYLTGLGASLSPAPLHVMLSGGGSASAERAAATPVLTVLSGPAGGVLGARDGALRVGIREAITLDMGGTSTDVAVGGETTTITTETVVGGVPIAAPAVEVLTVGAGGGSVAFVDKGGALRVGPRSAGAVPGPACYGRGGVEPTVTDAHVLLGHLAGRLGGGIALDREEARRAVATVAGRLGATTEATAAAILDVADAAMERPIRRLTVERGRDPRDLHLVAFGGAGGLHAVRLARSLGVRGVLLPVHPGLLSAMGMLAAPRRAETSRTILVRAPGRDLPDEVRRVGHALAEEASVTLEREEERTTVTLKADMRFVGQSHEITMELEDDALDRFVAEHRRRFGFAPPRAVEIVTVRAVAEARMPSVLPPLLAPAGPDPSAALDHVRPTSIHDRTSVYDRARLLAGMVVAGPAIVSELSATLLVPEGWRASVLERGDLLVVPEP